MIHTQLYDSHNYLLDTSNHTVTPQYLNIYNAARDSQRHSQFQGVSHSPSSLNMLVWRAYLSDYIDSLLCDFLEQGWPVDYSLNTWPANFYQDKAIQGLFNTMWIIIWRLSTEMGFYWGLSFSLRSIGHTRCL